MWAILERKQTTSDGRENDPVAVHEMHCDVHHACQEERRDDVIRKWQRLLLHDYDQRRCRSRSRSRPKDERTISNHPRGRAGHVL